MPPERRICFVTGTRAEFGLMRPVLDAIEAHPRLRLQIIATAMHLDRRFGYSVGEIRGLGYRVDATIPWPAQRAPQGLAAATGRAMARLAETLEKLGSDVVLVVGDRVEAFAGATAGSISGRIVAHVHGGDRALGQVDDVLRHAITKLSHLHFPATRESAQRLRKLGEDAWRIHCVGSPGIDRIIETAASARQLRAQGLALPARGYALVVLHPVDADEQRERRRAGQVLAAVKRGGIERIVIIYPNNDPGADGIIAAWEAAAKRDWGLIVRRNVARAIFLGLLRDAAVCVGNSSSGIIEAGSFGTPVVNVGPRQQGRQRGKNVTDVPYGQESIRRAVARIWNNGRPRRATGRNPYGGGAAGQRIADILARVRLDETLRRKLIAY